MSVLRPGVLLCAALISSPALYNAFVGGTLATDKALQRFGLALLLCAVGRAALVTLTQPARPPEGEIVEERRRTAHPPAGIGS